MAAQILVVDDDPSTTHLLNVALTRMNYQVALLHNGQQAIEYLQTHPLPHVLLLDYHLPYVNAESVLQILRQLDVGQNVRVVLISADPHVERLARQHGIQHVLPKPFRYQQLQQLLHEFGVSPV